MAPVRDPEAWRQNANTLELICSQVFNQNLLLRLDLKKLKQEAYVLGGPLVPINTSNVLAFESFVDDSLSYRVPVSNDGSHSLENGDLPVKAKQCSFQNEDS